MTIIREQEYSDPRRATDPYALPDMEIWEDTDGWYYWFCFPGCLPDSESIGPFDTREEALDDAGGENRWEDEEDEYDPED